ncbi:MAG: hypothetical protein KGS61_08845 [Verrucomicrobia bacterium]|nr:hypothetical protein [Verrucomicrobiota bacterium]
MPRRPFLVLWALVSVAMLGVGYQTLRHSQADTLFVPKINRIEAAPLCPWRQPEADLRRFFPETTGYRTDTRILSGMRLALARELGRPVLPEENALHLYRALAGNDWVGTVLVRRVKGEYGAIEIVVAVGRDGKVRGLRFQRLREPPAIAEALQDPAWQGRFQGQTRASCWRLGAAIPEVPAVARQSAASVVEGVHSLLVLLDTADRSGLTVAHGGH